MMRRLILLLLACLLLTGCTAHDPLVPMAATVTDEHFVIPEPDGTALPDTQESATLWFRFGAEPLLAPEQRHISVSPTTPYELALMQALLSGPAASSTELHSLFPPGTRVLSTHRQGRLLFVTLSRQIMNDYADEPDSWAADASWQIESPLRRTLAMQSIAATITENCDVDQVVILVEQSSTATDSLRLRQSYYRAGGDASALAAPLTRSEALLLSPQTTMETILQCWSERDWARLYLYTARRDPATGLDRPAYEDFAAAMDALPHLTDSRVSGGNVTADGQRAAFTLHAALLRDGHESALEDVLVRLCRERGIWRIGLSQLTGREAAP